MKNRPALPRSVPQSHCYIETKLSGRTLLKEKKFPSKDYIFFFVKTVVQVVGQSSDKQIGFFSAPTCGRGEISELHDLSTK